jgi:hypothetical protein
VRLRFSQHNFEDLFLLRYFSESPRDSSTSQRTGIPKLSDALLAVLTINFDHRDLNSGCFFCRSLATRMAYNPGYCVVCALEYFLITQANMPFTLAMCIID